MHSSRKRKHRSNTLTKHHDEQTTIQETDPDPLSVLFIQAHEADIIHGEKARLAADSLEVAFRDGELEIVGSGLIKWGHAAFSGNGFDGDERDFSTRPEDGKNAIWIDRYDARLLLDALPVPSSSSHPESLPDSPASGWSDLPSDSEDTFFFTPGEAEDYRRDKRRRTIALNREKRLQALRAEQGEEDVPEEEEVWGGSDEEPDDSEKELMRRTAAHILSSPNPAQLEMRILANYGADKRFAFLRGRWSRTWRLLKGRVKMEKEEKEKEVKSKSGAVLGLAAYGDSDSDAEQGKDADAEPEGKAEDNSAENVGVAQEGDTDEAAKEARRLRAKEWAEKRRALAQKT